MRSRSALACFEPESLAELERRRADFGQRQALFAKGLSQVGLTVPVAPDGAFYVYADCSNLCSRMGLAGSWELAFALMREARIAVTPGRDFGDADPQRYLRFSTAASATQLQVSLERLHALNLKYR